MTFPGYDRSCKNQQEQKQKMGWTALLSIFGGIFASYQPSLVLRERTIRRLSQAARLKAHTVRLYGIHIYTRSHTYIHTFFVEAGQVTGGMTADVDLL